jgi:hypothetical protein
VVEVRLARIDGDDRDATLSQDRVAVAEHLLEVHVADVAGVVVPGDDHDRLAIETIHVLARSQIFVAEPEGREVPRAHDDVGLELVDLADRTL